MADETIDDIPRREIDEPAPRVQFDDDEGGGEGWLISYADLMTLIACFFILMMTFANFEAPSYQTVANELARYFKGSNLSQDEQFTAVMIKIEAMSDINEVVEMKMNLNGVKLVFKSAHLFKSGEVEFNPKAKKYLAALIKVIAMESKEYNIIVEGHTDNIPIPPPKKVVKNSARSIIATNWELSALRAAYVVRQFEKIGFNPSRLRAIGYAHSQPEVPNRDEYGEPIPENMARNRRVVITVTKPTEKGFKMGLGTIYQKGATN